jgi:hypothetical protein
MGKILFILLLLSAISWGKLGSLHAEIYQWEDKDGNIQFTDDLGQVPPEFRKNAQRPPPQNDENSAGFNVVPSTPPTGPTPPNPPPEGTASDTSSQPEASPSSTSLPELSTKDEMYWRNRVKSAREELEKSRKGLDETLLSERKNLESGPGMHERQAKLQKERDELEKKVKNLEFQLREGILEEARKAGVPPGWAR